MVLWTALGVVVVGGVVAAAVVIANQDSLEGGTSGVVVRPLSAIRFLARSLWNRAHLLIVQ